MQNQNKNLLLWLLLFFPVGLFKLWRRQDIAIVYKVAATTFLFSMPLLVPKQPNRLPASAPIVRHVGVPGYSPEKLEEARKAIESLIWEHKNFKGRQGDIYLPVKVVRWQGHYLVSCSVQSAGHCGLYEVVFNANGGYQTYWVNGKGKQYLGNFISQTPNKYDISAAMTAATGD